MKLTLLGTGTPTPNPRRRGPSQVVESGDELILIDTGAGSVHRLVEAGYFVPPALRMPGDAQPAPKTLRRIAYTHLHSDHCTGLADILWAGWISRWWREEPPVIVGPPGTRQFVERLIHAFEYDIEVRLRGDRSSREELVPRVEEIEDGWAMEGGDWRLSAFRVDHEPVDQAFGFRIDEGASSLVISGDTNANDNLVAKSQEADLLVHEVYWAEGFRNALARQTDPLVIARQKMVAGYHTPSDELGRVATDASARHLVLSHVIQAGGAPEQIVADVSRGYKGPVTYGEDLQVYELRR